MFEDGHGRRLFEMVSNCRFAKPHFASVELSSLSSLELWLRVHRPSTRPSVVSALAKRGLAKRDWRNAMQPQLTVHILLGPSKIWTVNWGCIAFRQSLFAKPRFANALTTLGLVLGLCTLSHNSRLDRLDNSTLAKCGLAKRQLDTISNNLRPWPSSNMSHASQTCKVCTDNKL